MIISSIFLVYEEAFEEVSLGEIRFCAFILYFDEKSIFNTKFSINLLSIPSMGEKTKNIFSKYFYF